MTHSIVARDASTGELGIGVQTCYCGVGSIAPWARPGVGVVATQAFAERAYGPRCLAALGSGADAGAALAQAQALDPMAALRQVAVVGADRSTAVATGELCCDHAGHAGEVIVRGFADKGLLALPTDLAIDDLFR
jgi:uncharacterized Ntn-hydrolase superfamily protein